MIDIGSPSRSEGFPSGPDGVCSAIRPTPFPGRTNSARQPKYSQLPVTNQLVTEKFCRLTTSNQRYSILPAWRPVGAPGNLRPGDWRDGIRGNPDGGTRHGCEE